MYVSGMSNYASKFVVLLEPFAVECIFQPNLLRKYSITIWIFIGLEKTTYN